MREPDRKAVSRTRLKKTLPLIVTSKYKQHPALGIRPAQRGFFQKQGVVVESNIRFAETPVCSAVPHAGLSARKAPRARLHRTAERRRIRPAQRPKQRQNSAETAGRIVYWGSNTISKEFFTSGCRSGIEIHEIIILYQ